MSSTCRLTSLAVLIAAFPASASGQVRPVPSGNVNSCGVGAVALQRGGVGDVHVGMPVAQLKARCIVVLDTTIELGAEGLPERRVVVLIGNDSLRVEIERDRVWRIDVTSPRMRTADSLGIGTTVRQLRRKGAKFIGAGDAGFFLRVP